jgi:hypothetical protein
MPDEFAVRLRPAGRVLLTVAGLARTFEACRLDPLMLELPGSWAPVLLGELLEAGQSPPRPVLQDPRLIATINGCPVAWTTEGRTGRAWVYRRRDGAVITYRLDFKEGD